MGRVADAVGVRSRHDRGMAPGDPTRDVARLIDAGLDREAAEEGARTRPAGGTMDPITQLEQLGPHLGGVVAGIRPEQLDDPTPCKEYTVRGVLEHMISGATAFAAAYRGEPAAPPDLSDPLRDFGPVLGDLVGAITAPGALDQTVQAPFGPTPGETFARFVVLDGLVHGWDMARATGQPYAPPDELVAEADAFAREVLDPLRDGDTFADPTEPGSDA